MSESGSGSVNSLDSLCIDGCPVSPSILYDQRALVFETRKKQKNRKALTEYRTYKSRIVGKELICPQNGIDIIQVHPIQKREKAKTESHHFQQFYHSNKIQNLEMIFICT